LPADRTRVEADDAVEADLRGPPLCIPCAGPDVHPPGVPVLTHLTDTAGNMILAGEHESEHPFAVAADDEGGPVLALRVVLCERGPPPVDLPGAGSSVEVGGGADRDRTLVVAGIGGNGPARLRGGPRLLRRLPRCRGGPLSTVIRSLPASGLPLRLRLTQIAQALADSDSGCPIDQ